MILINPIAPVAISPELHTAEQLTYLSDFLNSPDRPAYTMNIMQLDGYLRAVAGGPGEARMTDWVKLIFADEQANFTDAEQEVDINNRLICLYNQHQKAVALNICALPFNCEYADNRALRIDAEQWARGFLQGYIFWQEIWGQILDETHTDSKVAVILPKTIYDEIDDILATVSCVADAEMAAHNGSSEEDINLMFNRLPETIVNYGQLGQMLRNASSVKSKN